jgi:predicted NAD/FAD-dependent oxidoreductase
MVRGMHAISQSVRFQWQATIQPLQPRSAFGWILQSQEHGTEPHRYQAVVLAVPAPQAAPLLAGVAPEAAALASNARMLPAGHSWCAAINRCHCR